MSAKCQCVVWARNLKFDWIVIVRIYLMNNVVLFFPFVDNQNLMDVGGYFVIVHTRFLGDGFHIHCANIHRIARLHDCVVGLHAFQELRSCLRVPYIYIYGTSMSCRRT